MRWTPCSTHIIILIAKHISRFGMGSRKVGQHESLRRQIFHVRMETKWQKSDKLGNVKHDHGSGGIS